MQVENTPLLYRDFKKVVYLKTGLPSPVSKRTCRDYTRRDDSCLYTRSIIAANHIYESEYIRYGMHYVFGLLVFVFFLLLYCSRPFVQCFILPIVYAGKNTSHDPSTYRMYSMLLNGWFTVHFLAVRMQIIVAFSSRQAHA